jgi:hypothetical protein
MIQAKRADWVSRLFSVFNKYQKEQFQFGAHDCGMFAARCIDSMTDSNWEETLTYKGKRGAARLLRHEGGLEALVTRRFGEPVLGHMARRGDICLINKHTLGVCRGPEIVVCSENSLETYPLSRALKHWRIE